MIIGNLLNPPASTCRLITLAIICLLALSACGQNSNQDGLGSAVFSALKKNDFEQYQKYIIRKSEVLLILQHLRESSEFEKYTPKKRAHMDQVIKNMTQSYTKLRQKLKKNFSQTVQHGITSGIDWSKARFKKILISGTQSLFELKNITQQHIHIVFTYNHNEYQLRLNNNVKLSRGWVIVDGLYWDHLPQNNHP